MTPLQLAAGGAAGMVLGWLAWLTSERFLAHARIVPSVPRLLRTGAPISLAIAMIAMTLWGAYVSWQAASLAVAASALVVTALLLCIALVDFQVWRIPDPLVLALLAWAAMQVVWLGQPAPLAAAAGLLVAGGLFLLLRLVSRGAMGMGDVKLEAALGALLGFPVIVNAMLLGVIAGGLAALVLLLSRRAGRKDPIAYGPYLALGAWIILVQAWRLWPI